MSEIPGVEGVLYLAQWVSLLSSEVVTLVPWVNDPYHSCSACHAMRNKWWRFWLVCSAVHIEIQFSFWDVKRWIQTWLSREQSSAFTHRVIHSWICGLMGERPPFKWVCYKSPCAKVWWTPILWPQDALQCLKGASKEAITIWAPSRVRPEPWAKANLISF